MMWSKRVAQVTKHTSSSLPSFYGMRSLLEPLVNGDMETVQLGHIIRVILESSSLEMGSGGSLGRRIFSSRE